jgi:hypothetical protein
LGTDTVDTGEELSDLLGIEPALDIGFEITNSAAQNVDVSAGVTDLQLKRLGVVLGHGDLGGSDEGAGELLADVVATIVTNSVQAW